MENVCVTCGQPSDRGRLTRTTMTTTIISWNKATNNKTGKSIAEAQLKDKNIDYVMTK